MSVKGRVGMWREGAGGCVGVPSEVPAPRGRWRDDRRCRTPAGVPLGRWREDQLRVGRPWGELGVGVQAGRVTDELTQSVRHQTQPGSLGEAAVGLKGGFERYPLWFIRAIRLVRFNKMARRLVGAVDSAL